MPVSEALTQALMLRYQSPFIDDRFGVRASWFGNAKLVGEDGEGGTGLLQDEEDGEQASYAKLAEIVLDLKLTEQSELNLGRQVLHKPLLNDPDYRATPTSSQAGRLQFANDSTTIYGVASDRGSGYTETDFSHYTDLNGESFSIYSLGFSHRFRNALLLETAIGRADNVMDQLYLNVRYPWQIDDNTSLLFDAYQYSGRANGEGAIGGIGSDHHSDLSNIALQLTRSSSRLTLSYQAVRGDNYQVSWDGDVHDNTSYLSWQSVQRLNFDRAGEDSWQIRLDHDFGGVLNGLWAMARYVSGDNIDRSDGAAGSEWERDIDFIYSPPDVEGLSFRWRYAVVRSSETYDSDEHRLIINYSTRAL